MTEQTPTTTPDVVSDTTSETMPDSAPKTGMATMVTAAAATIGASLCCIGPLVLLSLGIGGAWVSSLTALTPYRPYFIGSVISVPGISQTISGAEKLQAWSCLRHPRHTAQPTHYFLGCHRNSGRASYLPLLRHYFL